MSARSLSLPALLIARLLMGQPDFLASIGKTQERPSLALPDLRGAGGPSTVVDQMNSVLWEELDGSGVLRMIPKVLYPLRIPQQPADFGPKQGSALKDWSAPPVDSDYLAFGYATEQSGRLVLLGWLYNMDACFRTAHRTDVFWLA